MSILIVDDYKTMLRIIRNLLKQLGFNSVDEAIDGSSALTKLRDKDFGLVISDWNMEPMSGLQLLKEVRADVKLKDIPFIMITAESKSENVIAAKEAGVSNYIVKPFNAATLKGKLTTVLGNF
jgi:two-component system chemotaxis response regulator CheY